MAKRVRSEEEESMSSSSSASSPAEEQDVDQEAVHVDAEEDGDSSSEDEHSDHSDHGNHNLKTTKANKSSKSNNESDEENGEKEEKDDDEDDDDNNEEETSETGAGKKGDKSNDNNNDGNKNNTKKTEPSAEEARLKGMLLLPSRSICQAIKKVHRFELQKAIRKLKSGRDTAERIAAEAKKKGDGELAKKTPDTKRLQRKVSVLKAFNYRPFARQLIQSAGISVPEKLEKEWEKGDKYEKAKADEDDEDDEGEEAQEGIEEARTAILEAFEDRLKKHKAVISTVRKLEERVDYMRTRKKILKNRRRREARAASNTEEARKARKIPCGVSTCQARFLTTEARLTHWRLRHPQTYTDQIEVIGVDPHDPFAEISSKPRNRMGQRERQRQAAIKESRERRKAIARGEAPPPPKRLKREKDSKAAATAAAGEGADATAADILNTKSGDAAAPAAAAEDTKNLHPSWQAKLETKPQIVAFEGKKMVFDESDDDSDDDN
mmetsp:Transcript_2165/g.3778  ORF Transcript_2165/g.3778 Transcript_2165/m.3778 type:complete len:494 (+) Transcript_2165:300-1781(+)